MYTYRAAPVAQQVKKKKSTCKAGDPGDESSIPGSGRSPGGGNGNPLQYSCLGNPTEQKSLSDYSPKHPKESDRTERLTENACIQYIQLIHFAVQ